MKLSERLARLGTETAFEVLVRARALEAQGRSIVHLEIGEPDFDTPGHIIGGGHRRAPEGWRHPLRARRPACPSCARPSPRTRPRRRGVRATPEMVVVTPGGKPVMFYVILALVDPGDEVLYPNPGFPIYESMIRYIGGMPGARAPARGAGLRARRRPADLRTHRPEDAADHPQLPAQPDRRDRPRVGPARDRRRRRAPRRARARRRDLLAHPLRRPSTSRSRRCPAWSRSRSCSTASRRRTR